MNRIGHSWVRGWMLVSTAMGLAGAAHAQTASAPYLTAYRYTTGGLLTGKISPAPSGSSNFLATRNSYDANGRLQKVETGVLAAWQDDTVAPSAWSGFTIGSTTTYSYDASGNKIKETVAGSDGVTAKVTQYSYDEYDRLVCTAERMDSAQWNGQADACVPQTNGPKGPDRIIKNAYDSLNRVIQVRKAVGITGLEQAYVTYSYNADSKQEYVIDANGNRAQQTYDGYDRKSGWYFPSATAPTGFDGSTQATALSTAGSVNTANGFETYQYDNNGNMLTRVIRNGTQIGYTYDALNRMSTKTLPAGNPNLSSAYNYDLAGHLVSMTNGDTTTIYKTATTYTYDGFGNMTSEAQGLGVGTGSLATHTLSSSIYDADGNRKKLIWDGSFYVTYQYDGLNRMSDINEGDTTNLVHFVYDTFGRRQTLQRANGTSTAYGYDPMSRLNDLQLKSGSTVVNDYGFLYNPANQITQRTLTNSNFAWTGAVGVNRTYTPNGLNQYSAISGIANPTYDPKGNLTQAGGPTYSYNAENELATQLIGSTTYRFYYDPHHRLINSTQTGVRLQYDGDKLAAEYDSSGNLLRRYVFGPNPDEALVWYEGSGTTSKRWLAADGQGSIVQVTDASGTTLATNTYDEYGIPASSNDTYGSRFRYTGQQWLSELGMSYYKARIYSPTLGRFMQTDPAGYKDQVNLYSYVKNDPVSEVDPTGQDSYLVARPLGSAVLSTMRLAHSFVVVGARYPGDPQARVISYGDLANGKMGNVNNPARAADMSKPTHATDVAAWNSLKNSKSDASYSKINAPDKIVAAVANAVVENNKYAAVPRVFSPLGNDANSNSAAREVADTAAKVSGGSETAEPSGFGLPGWNEADRVKIDMRKVCTTEDLHCY